MADQALEERTPTTEAPTTEVTTTSGTVAVESRGVARAMALVRDRAGDVTFGALVAFSVVYWVRLTSRSYFFADDWLMLHQIYDGGYFKPYNEHLSAVILGMWRVLAAVGEGSYWPFQVTGIVVRCLVSVAVYVAVRMKLGPLVACCIGTLTLWCEQYDLFPATLNHYLVLVAAAACAALLDRGRRADLPLALAVAFGLLSAGGGVAVVAACLVHSACTRAPLRRWLAIVGPAASWLLWFVVMSEPSSAGGGEGSPVSRVVDAGIYARDLIFETGVRVVVDLAPAGIIILVGYVVFGVWTLRGGLRQGANYLAWTSAILVWAYGLGASRSFETISALAPNIDPRELKFPPRYLLTVLIFMILALLPRKRVTWPTLETRSPAVRRAVILGLTAAMLLFVSARVASTRGDLQEAAKATGFNGTQAHILALQAAAGPSVVPEDAAPSLLLGYMPPDQVREVLVDLGLDGDITGAQFDRAMVDEDLIRADVTARGARTCDPGSTDLADRPPGVLRLWSDRPTWKVSVRAAGEDWLPLITGQGDQVIKITFPNTGRAGPWQVRADGACRVES